MSGLIDSEVVLIVWPMERRADLKLVDYRSLRRV